MPIPTAAKLVRIAPDLAGIFGPTGLAGTLLTIVSLDVATGSVTVAPVSTVGGGMVADLRRRMTVELSSVRTVRSI